MLSQTLQRHEHTSVLSVPSFLFSRRPKKASKELPALALAVCVQVAKLFAGAFPHHGTSITNGSVSVRSTGVQLKKSCATDIPTGSNIAAEQRRPMTFCAPIR